MAYRVLATTRGVTKQKDVLREYEPAMRVVYVGRPAMPKYVQFPTTLFYYRGHCLFVAFAKDIVTSLQTPVYCPTVSNIYGGWRICGARGKDIDHAIRSFFQYAFNGDGSHHSLNRNLDGWTGWVKKSKAKTSARTISNKLNHYEKTLGWFLRIDSEYGGYRSKQDAEDGQRIKLDFDAPYIDYEIEMNLPKLPASKIKSIKSAKTAPKKKIAKKATKKVAKKKVAKKKLPKKVARR